MLKKYKDFYGCTATIRTSKGQYKLVMKTAAGKTIGNNLYDTFNGARIAMGKSSDGWKEVKEGE
jgi:hypothetical protein